MRIPDRSQFQYSLFSVGQEVTIPTPDGEIVPARIVDFTFDTGYICRVRADRYCQHSGKRYAVHESILRRYNYVPHKAAQFAALATA